MKLDSAARHHARLLGLFTVILGVMDAFAAVQTRLMARPPFDVAVPQALAPAAAMCAVAYIVNRKGYGRAALVLLVIHQLAAAHYIAIRAGERDAAAAFNLGVWSIIPLLIAAAFVGYRAVLAIGGVCTAAFLLSASILGVLTSDMVSSPLVFLATVTALVAVVTRHRDALDAIHQAELRGRNDELAALSNTLEQRVTERTAALLTTEKMAVIGRLTAGIAHEMSSPLAAVVGSLDGLHQLVEEYQRSIGDDGVDVEDHRAIAREMSETLEVAWSGANRSMAFVRSIKAQTRVGVVGQHEGFDAAGVARECVQLLGHAARAARCKIEVHAPGPVAAHGLPSRLGQVITNLLQNAIDATGDRGGGAIEINVDRAGSAITVRVRDEGGGIPDDVLPNIFDPLFTTKPYGRGTGLGLAIVKEAVEADLKGQIQVETKVGVGSTFTVSFPAEQKEVVRAA